MSVYNRYKFIKDIYSNYIIFIKKKNKYYTYDIDNKMLRSLKVNYYKDIDKYKINYLLINNLEIINKVEYKNNNYNKYLINYLINEIYNRYKEREDGYNEEIIKNISSYSNNMY